MNESKVENQGLKFDLMRAQEPSEESEDQQDQDQEGSPELGKDIPIGDALKTSTDADPLAEA